MKPVTVSLALLVAAVIPALVQTYGNHPGGDVSRRYFLHEGETINMKFFCLRRGFYLVRAVGPSLSKFGETNLLSDPAMQVFVGRSLPDESREIYVFTRGLNDDWPLIERGVTYAVERTGAFPLVSGSRDAALVLELDRGFFTVQVKASGKAESANLPRAGRVLIEILRFKPDSY